MKHLSETNEKKEEAAAFAIWDCGSPLYDSYELASLSHLIERNFMKLPSLGGSKRLTTKFSHHPCDVTPATSSDSTSNARAKEPSSSSSSLMRSVGEFLGSRFWKRRRIGERRDKPERLRTGLRCFCHRAGHCKK